jgi:putative ABC transport system permease protein
MTAVWKDIKYSVRMLVKNPGFTLVAVIALALGIGANTAIFSVVNAVLLKPLPYKNPERLVMLWEQPAQGGRMSVAGLNFLEWRKESRLLEDIMVFSNASFDLTGPDAAERIEGTRASVSYFDMLGGQAMLGRTFQAGDDAASAPRVVVVSHGFWQSRLGGDPAAIGREIKLNDEPRTVIGVMPPDFGDRIETWVWTPIIVDPEQMSVGGRSLSAIARLKPGVTLGQAQGEMSAIAARLAEVRPQFNRGWGVSLVPLHEQVTGNVRLILLVLSGAVGLVLLIACANVANLLLASAARREHEMAIRTALGASRARLSRQVLTESVLLALLGGALGLLLALWGIDLLLGLAPGSIPRAREIGINSQVLGFTLLVSFLTGIVFGLAPAWQSLRGDLSAALKGAGKSSSGSFQHSRLRSALVVVEVALAIVLLVGAGLLMRSFVRLTEVDPGFSAGNVLLLEVPLSTTRYSEDHQVLRFYDEMFRRVRSLPGVEAAGTTHSLPLGGSDSTRPFIIADAPLPDPGTEPSANYSVISPDYFRTMGIPVVRGREFLETDNAGAPGVVLINQSLARRYWKDEDPVGKRLRQGAVSNESPWLTIVGVVGDVRHGGLDREPRPEMYFSYAQAAMQQSSSIAGNRRRITLAVRVDGNPASYADAVRREISGIDKNQPVTGVRTLGETVARSVMPQRFNALLLGIFAGLAVLLAMIGVYGVMNFAVTGRTREIGIRMALGARGADVVRMIVGQGMLLVVIGVIIGLASSFVLTRLIANLLYETSATDPVVFAIIPTLLGLAALIACYIPARRATKIDPMIALRYE